MCELLRSAYRHLTNNDLIITNYFTYKVTILIMLNSFRLTVMFISMSVVLLQFNSKPLHFH